MFFIIILLFGYLPILYVPIISFWDSCIMFYYVFIFSKPEFDNSILQLCVIRVFRLHVVLQVVWNGSKTENLEYYAAWENGDGSYCIEIHCDCPTGKSLNLLVIMPLAVCVYIKYIQGDS